MSCPIRMQFTEMPFSRKKPRNVLRLLLLLRNNWQAQD